MKLRTILLGCAACVATTPAFADDAAVMKRLDDMQRMIEQQQQHIADQDAQIAGLKKALGKKGGKVVTVAAAPAPAPAVASDEVRQQFAAQQAQIDKLAMTIDDNQNAYKIDKQEQSTVSLAGGRPTFTSPDGRFSVSLRLLGQYDMAYYSQDGSARILPTGPDLSSGSNFRRAQIGFQGKLFGDWSYFFNTEFGGSNGFESQGRVQTLYVQYDGLKPFAFRIGAYPPPAGLEDNTSSSDTIFLERAQPSDIMRRNLVDRREGCRHGGVR
jgi:phosphate-selective porin OprO/OprP